MITKIGSNIEKRMRQKKMTQKGLALKAGLNETAVRDIIQGRSKDPQLSTLRALSSILECSVEDFYRDPPRDKYGLADKHTPFAWPGDVGKTAAGVVPDLIPEIDITEASGPAVLTNDKKRQVFHHWQIPSELLQDCDPARLVIIKVRGDAMAPDFADGDRVMLDLKNTSPSPSGIFMLWDGTGLMLRQCEMKPYTKPAMLLLKAHNKRYNTHEVALKAVTICGRVISKWQRV